MVVDDNRFTRNLLRGVLLGFGVERVEVMRNGAEAIERLSRKSSVAAADLPLIDIILSDFVMPSVDGLMLLRWIRQSKESPNRFVPFIMFSAESREGAVKAAREAGAHEFIAKPFSPETLGQHLLSLIDRPRPFTYCASFFGPDRRREAHRFDGPERRVMSDADIHTVYANRAPTPLRRGGPKVWCFRLPNTMRAKVGGAGPGETGAIDAAQLEAADQHIGEMEDDYADWVTATIAELTKAVEHCRTHPLNAAGPFRRINRIALELRGQGGMFGYPLVSTFCESLHGYTECDGPQDEQHIELIAVHVDAINAVIKQKIRGDGGPVGAEMVASLRGAQRRYDSEADPLPERRSTAI